MPHGVSQTYWWSSIASFTPHSTTLFADASRIKYHTNCHTTYYVRYNDSTYFCNTVYPTVLSTPISSKIPMPPSFIITDFRPIWSLQGFIGSYQGVGYYGYAYHYYSLTNNYLHSFKIPDVDRLTRITTIDTRTSDDRAQTKAFAIGEKSNSKVPPQSYILEFYAYGIGELYPYMYAPLAFDPATSEQETADDVIDIDNYVIFATRDTRQEHAPVNLRISDTTSVLTNTDIDYQWRFVLPDNYGVVSELRLIRLQADDFILAYVIFDSQTNKYHLYTHRIILPDLLAGNNTVETHQMVVRGACTKLMDIVYEFNVNTLVMLLNGGGTSKIYHTDPYVSGSSSTIVLDYNRGELYDIDTMGCYSTDTTDMYIAIGGTDFFSQDISNGVNIIHSCLNKTDEKMLPENSPKIIKKEDPILRYSGVKSYSPYEKPADYIYGTATCIEISN